MNTIKEAVKICSESTNGDGKAVNINEYSRDRKGTSDVRTDNLREEQPTLSFSGLTKQSEGSLVWPSAGTEGR